MLESCSFRSPQLLVMCKKHTCSIQISNEYDQESTSRSLMIHLPVYIKIFLSKASSVMLIVSLSKNSSWRCDCPFTSSHDGNLKAAQDNNEPCTIYSYSDKQLFRHDFIVCARCSSCSHLNIHKHFHSHAKDPSPQLVNSRAGKVRIDNVLSSKLS